MSLKKLSLLIGIGLMTSVTLYGCNNATNNEQTDKASSVEVTLEEIKEANRTENLLKNCDSFLIQMEDQSDTWQYYADSELVYYEDSDMSELTTKNTKFGKYSRFISGSLYVEEPMDITWCDNLLFEETYYEDEELVDCVQKDDKLLLTTQIPTESYVDIVGHRYEGDYVLLEYILNKETYAIEEFTETVMHKNNTTTISLTATVEYNAARPEMAEELLSHATQTENLRTVTVIVAPDTPDEKTYSVSVPVGDDVEIYKPDKYKKMYMDRNCTQDLPSTTDLSKDATYYIPGKS